MDPLPPHYEIFGQTVGVEGGGGVDLGYDFWEGGALFKGNFVEMCTAYFPLAHWGGANGQACTDGEWGPPSAWADIFFIILTFLFILINIIIHTILYKYNFYFITALNFLGIASYLLRYCIQIAQYCLVLNNP
jgi:hypothetical protein